MFNGLFLGPKTAMRCFIDSKKINCTVAEQPGSVARGGGGAERPARPSDAGFDKTVLSDATVGKRKTQRAWYF